MIHVWYIVEKGAPGLKLNAPLFEGVAGGALVRGTWGAKPAAGLEPKRGDFVVEKMRMSAWQDTKLETLLPGSASTRRRQRRVDEHVDRAHRPHRGGQGLLHARPEDCCSTMNADWHNASINYALQNVSTVTDGKTVAAALGR